MSAAPSRGGASTFGTHRPTEKSSATPAVADVGESASGAVVDLSPIEAPYSTNEVTRRDEEGVGAVEAASSIVTAGGCYCFRAGWCGGPYSALTSFWDRQWEF